MRKIYIILLLSVIFTIVGCQSNNELVPAQIDMSKSIDLNNEQSNNVKTLIVDYLKDKDVKGNIENSIIIKEVKSVSKLEKENINLYTVDLDYAWINGLAVFRDNKLLGILSAMSRDELMIADLNNDNNYEIILKGTIGSGILGNIIEVMNIEDGKIYSNTVRENNKNITMVPNDSDNKLYLYWQYNFNNDDKTLSKDSIGYLIIEDEKLIIKN